MPDIANILQSGGNGWIYLPIAVLLGALHGLEPGHSKTMMAAYIVAIRGTIGQAVLLGLSAALSHSLVVLAIAMIGLSFGREVITTHFEAWLLLASGVIVLAIASWMLWRTGQSLGWFRRAHHDHEHHHDHHDHDHDHDHDRHDDAHAREHAEQIRRQLAATGGRVTSPQIALFGLTGGLIPCPASITVLLVCLQLGQFTLGAATVAAFSLGLALTMVGIGVAAAWGLRHASKRFSLSDRMMQRLPLVSTALVGALGLVMLAQGVSELSSPAALL